MAARTGSAGSTQGDPQAIPVSPCPTLFSPIAFCISSKVVKNSPMKSCLPRES